MQKFFQSDAWAWIKVVIELAILVTLIIFGVSLARNAGLAEEYKEGYIICVPGDYVNVRPFANIRSEAIGYLEPGDKVYLDGIVKNGFCHCVNMNLESYEGWVHKGYIVFDEPEYVNQNATIVSKGRLAARKYVNGKRTRWLKPLATVKIYYMSEEWSVTNCGYVKTKFLELEGE